MSSSELWSSGGIAFPLSYSVTFFMFQQMVVLPSGSETTGYPETHDAQEIKRRCRKKAGS